MNPNIRLLILISILNGCASIVLREQESAQSRIEFPIAPIKLTNDGHNNYSPYPFPGNDKFIFVSDRNGNQDIWQSENFGIKEQALTTHSADDYHPALNQKGSKMAFVSRRDDAAGDIYIMTVNSILGSNGKTTRIKMPSSEESHPAWRPGRDEVVFVSRSDGLGAAQLKRYDIDSSSISSFNDISGDFPSFDPSGRYLSYVREGQLWYYDSKEKKNELVEIPAHYRPTSSSWLSDGSAIVFSAYGYDTDADFKLSGSDQAVLYRVEIAMPENSRQRFLTPIGYSDSSHVEPQVSGELIFGSAENAGNIDVVSFPLSGTIDDKIENEKIGRKISGETNATIAIALSEALIYRARNSNNAVNFLDSTFIFAANLIRVGTFSDLGYLKNFAAGALQLSKPLEASCRLFRQYGLKILDYDRETPLSQNDAKALQKIAQELRSPWSPEETKSHSLKAVTLFALATIEFENKNYKQVDSYLDQIESQDETIVKDILSVRLAELKMALVRKLSGITEAIKVADLIAMKKPADSNERKNIVSLATKLLNSDVANLKDSDRTKRYISFLSKAKGPSPVAAATHLYLADHLLATGKSAMGINELREILASRTYSYDTVIGAADKLVNVMGADLELASVEQQLKPIITKWMATNPAKALRIKKIVTVIANRKADDLFRSREYGMAIKLYRAALEYDREDKIAAKGIVDAQFYRGKILNEIARLEKLYQQDPSAWNIYLYLYAKTYLIDTASGAYERYNISSKLIDEMTDLRKQTKFDAHMYQTLGWLYLQRDFWWSRAKMEGGFSVALAKRWRIIAGAFGDSDNSDLNLSVKSFQSGLFLAKEGSSQKSKLSQNLSEAYRRLGNEKTALEHCVKRVQTLSKYPTVSERASGILLYNCARSASYSQEYALAEKLYSGAIKSWEKVGDDNELARALDGLAYAYFLKNDFAASLGVYERLGKLQKSKGEFQNLATTMTNTANCYLKQKKFTQASIAIKLAMSYIDIDIDRPNENTSDDSIAVDLGGGSIASKGFSPQLRKLLLQSMQVRVMAGLGDQELVKEALLKKKALVESVLESKSIPEDVAREMLAVNRNNLAVAEYKRGNFDQAEAYFIKNIEWLDSMDSAKERNSTNDRLRGLKNLVRINNKRVLLASAPSPSGTAQQAIYAYANQVREGEKDGKYERCTTTLEQQLCNELIHSGYLEVNAKNSVPTTSENRELQSTSSSYPANIVLANYIFDKQVYADELASKEFREVRSAVLLEKGNGWQYLYAQGLFLESMEMLEKSVEEGVSLNLPEKLLVARLLRSLLSVYQENEALIWKTKIRGSEIFSHLHANNRSKKNVAPDKEPLSKKGSAPPAPDIKTSVKEESDGSYSEVLWFGDGEGDHHISLRLGTVLKSWRASSTEQKKLLTITKAINDLLQEKEKNKVYIVPIGAANPTNIASLIGDGFEFSFVPSLKHIAEVEKTKFIGRQQITKITRQPTQKQTAAIGDQDVVTLSLAALVDHKHPQISTDIIDFSDVAVVKPYAEKPLVFSFNNQTSAPKAPLDPSSLAKGGGPLSSVLFIVTDHKNPKDAKWYEYWRDAYSLVESKKFSSVLFCQNAKRPGVYSGFLKMSISEVSKKLCQSGSFVLGHAGYTYAEEKERGEEYLDVLYEQTLDFYADKKWRQASNYGKQAYFYANLIGDEEAKFEMLDTVIKAQFATTNYSGAYSYQIKKNDIFADRNKPVPASELLLAGILAMRAEKYDDAISILNKAEEAFIEVKDFENIASVFRYQGMTYERSRKFTSSISAFNKSREASIKGDELTEAARRYVDIANIQREYLSDYQAASRYFKLAAAEFREEDEELDLWNAEVDYANTLLAMGRVTTAVDLLEPLTQEIDADEDLQIWARANQILGNAYYRAGLFDEAQRVTSKIASKIDALPMKTPNDIRIQLDASNLKAMVLARMGSFEEAMAVFDDGLVIAQQNRLSRRQATRLNNMGYWSRENGDIDRSIVYFNRALLIDRETNSKSSIAFDLRNLGLSYLAKEEFQRAEQLLTEAIEISEQIGQQYNFAYSLFGIGEVKMRQGRNQEALERFKQAEKIAVDSNLKDFQWMAITAQGKIYEKISSDQNAVERYYDALGVVEGLRANLTSSRSKQNFLGNQVVQQVYENLVSLLMKLGRSEEAWGISERSRSRAFIDSLGQRRFRSGSAEATSLVAKEKQLINDLEDLKSEFRRSQKEALSAAIEQKKKALLSVRTKMNKLSPMLGMLSSVSSVSIEVLKNSLKQSSVVVEYMVTDENLYTWLIDRNSIRGYSQAIKRAKLESMFEGISQLLESKSSIRFVKKDWSDLLLAPVEEELGNYTNIIFVPHNALHHVPFAMLSAGGKDLIDSHSIVYADSATLLSIGAPKRSTNQDAEVLVFGNPDRGIDFNLPFAVREANAINRYSKTKIFLGEMATESEFKSSLQQADFVHIASHGEFNEKSPMESRLLLAKSKVDDGDLSANEIFGLTFKPGSSVVLSACETGRGKVTSGDEISGLNRAFFYAGASTVISSLWRISDVSSAVIMKRFYRYIRAGDSQEVALAKSQRIVRKYYPHPAYWAAFRLVTMNIP